MNEADGGFAYFATRMMMMMIRRSATRLIVTVVRPPASFPGTLTGVSHAGALLYADVTPQDDAGAAPPQLQALAYDGAGASVVDSLPLPATWRRSPVHSGM